MNGRVRGFAFGASSSGSGGAGGVWNGTVGRYLAEYLSYLSIEGDLFRRRLTGAGLAVVRRVFRSDSAALEDDSARTICHVMLTHQGNTYELRISTLCNYERFL